METVPQYLTRKYLEWQQELGERKTLEEMGDYIGVSRSIVSYWMNGKRVPNKEAVEKIARKFGNEIYDIMGIERPNEYQQIINRVFEHLPEEVQRRFAEEAITYETQAISDRVQKASKRRKTRNAK